MTDLKEKNAAIRDAVTARQHAANAGRAATAAVTNDVELDWSPDDVIEIADDATMNPLPPRKIRVYIAGPMRGIELFNFPAFDAARDELEARGYEVVSPADLDRASGFDPERDCKGYTDWHRVPDSFSLDAAIERDVAAIRDVDELVLLPGWHASRGACGEKALAEWYGKRVWELQSEDILDEAARITRGSRQAQYGPPDQDFRRTAGMWSALFADLLRPGAQFEPTHVAQAMILLKMSRQQHQQKRDNWVDVAGYARCGAMCDEVAK